MRLIGYRRSDALENRTIIATRTVLENCPSENLPR
jgi:hypothetical protein